MRPGKGAMSGHRFNRPLWPHRIGVLALVAVFSAGACTGGREMSEEPALDHVRAIVLPFLTSVPFHIAAEKGYFLDHGLDVEFIRLPRTQDTMTALARGQVDVGTGMLTVNVLNSIVRGARVRLVAALARLEPDACPFNAIVVRRELMESGALQNADRIRQMRWDLDITLPHGFWIETLLAPFELTIADLDINDVPEPASVEALRNGSLDVAVPSEPFLGRHIATGETAVWRATNEVVPDYVVSVMSYGPSLLDERQEVGERFAAAMLQAMRRYRLGKTPENLAVVEAATGLEPELVASACWPTPSVDGRIDASGFREFQEWAVSRSLLDRVLADDELVDPRFIESANDVLSR